jgi:hypothetical protein
MIADAAPSRKTAASGLLLEVEKASSSFDALIKHKKGS